MASGHRLLFVHHFPRLPLLAYSRQNQDISLPICSLGDHLLGKLDGQLEHNAKPDVLLSLPSSVKNKCFIDHYHRFCPLFLTSFRCGLFGLEQGQALIAGQNSAFLQRIS